MLKKITVVLCIFILSESCGQTKFNIISDPSKRLKILGVSILPPQEQGWHILYLSAYQLTIKKEIPDRDETYVVQVSLYKLSDIESEQEFLNIVSKGRANEPETGRFKVLQNREEMFHGREGYCMRFHTFSEDRSALLKSYKKVKMTLEMFGYHCQHPKNKNVGVIFEYSHRYYSGERNPNFEKQAENFLSQIKFIDF